MGEDPRAIRNEIEETRERMGDTVEALAYKGDVKSRAKDSVNDKVQTVKEKVVGAKDSVSGTVSERTPDSDQMQHQAKRAVGIAQENPLGLALGVGGSHGCGPALHTYPSVAKRPGGRKKSWC